LIYVKLKAQHNLCDVAHYFGETYQG